MLAGDFPNAHVALVEAQKRLPDPEHGQRKGPRDRYRDRARDNNDRPYKAG